MKKLILILFLPSLCFALTQADFNSYSNLAHKGNEFAQFDLGVMYYKGSGLKKNYQKAYYWLNKVASEDLKKDLNTHLTGLNADEIKKLKQKEEIRRENIKKAQYLMGQIYLKGRGVKKDFKKAILWHELAAKENSALSQYALGKIHYEGKGVPKSYHTALSYFEKAADQGEMNAQYRLAFMYYKKEGLLYKSQSKTLEKAFHYFKKASLQGHHKAQYELALMYFKGLGVRKNNKKAFKWFKKTSLKNNKQAQFYLSMIYERGLGLSKNKRQADFWYEKALKLGLKQARKSLKKSKKRQKIDPSKVSGSSVLIQSFYGKAGGFFISENFILTSYKSLKESIDKNRKVFLIEKKDHKKDLATLLVFDEANDLALLNSFNENEDGFLNLGSFKDLNHSKNIMTLEFSEKHFKGLSVKSKIKTDLLLETPYPIEFSASPVLSKKDFKVIGLVRKTQDRQIFIPIDKVKSLIKKKIALLKKVDNVLTH